MDENTSIHACHNCRNLSVTSYLQEAGPLIEEIDPCQNYAVVGQPIEYILLLCEVFIPESSTVVSDMPPLLRVSENLDSICPCELLLIYRIGNYLWNRSG